MSKENFKVESIPSKETYEWLLKKHYAKRIPSISYAFGLFENKKLVGVCTFGSPSSSPLRSGIAGNSFIDHILELNRLCVDSKEVNITSWFVSKCLKLVGNKIIISYADTSQGHLGKIYQATNFLYTGLSAKRTDWKIKGLEHLHGQTIADESRGQKNRAKYMREKYGNRFYLEDRPRKHRYIYIAGEKKYKKKTIKFINYPVCNFPKGKTQRYNAEYKPISQGLLF